MISQCVFHSNAINIAATGCTYYIWKDRINLVAELNGYKYFLRWGLFQGMLETL